MKRAPIRPFRTLVQFKNFFFVSKHHYLLYRRNLEQGKLKDNTRVETARTIHNWGRELTERWQIKVNVQGDIPEGPVLFTPNHFGYADIIVFASVTDMMYVAKKDTGDWPLIGSVIRGLELPLIDRKLGNRALVDVTRQVEDALKAGASVSVFAEGTSTGGEDGVLPFHPAVFHSAIKASVPIQPVAMKWTISDGKACVPEDIAYWKDHVFVPHLIKFLGLKNITLDVKFCEPIDPKSGNRNEVAALAHERVSTAYKELLDS